MSRIPVIYGTLEPMNVVVIVLDTFRHDIVGPGKALSHVATPNLDRFAEAGVSFDSAYGEGQPTLQVRRAFFTGRRSFPWRYNFDRRGHWHHAPGWHKIPPEQNTIAEILSEYGYTTGLIGDVYHMFKPTMNYTRGFSSYEFIRGQESDNYRTGTLDSIRDEITRCVREPVNWERHRMLVQYLWNMRGRGQEDDYLCAQVFSRACRWIEDNGENRPFMLWVEAFDPHEPWDPPKRWADHYAPEYDGKDFIAPGAGFEHGPMSPEEIERTKALYYGEASFVDERLGKLLDTLEERGLMDDTMVMILSDHGTQVYDHGAFGKGAGARYRCNTGILWLMRHPDGPEGKRIDRFVQTHDLMPTILDYLDIPFETDGASVRGLVDGSADSIRDTIVSAWAEFSQGTATARVSVRDGRWNLVRAVGRTDDEPLLFDLAADPDETLNVIDANPEVDRELSRAVESLIGMPLPGVMNEVCDHPVPAPMSKLRFP